MRQTRQAIRRARRARPEARIFVGPVIASIHEKRAQRRAEIMAASDFEREPTLGRQRARRRGDNQGARNHGPRNLGSAQALSGHG